MNLLCNKRVLLQFIRYFFVGGFAFVVDFGVLIGCRELLFKEFSWGVYVSVLLAFFAGHTTNYVLSMMFVFTDPDERRKGLTLAAFGMFAIVGFVGVGITEFGMWIGYGLLHINYVLTKAIMAAIVFSWNFLGRKLVVMNRKDPIK